jgi:uncharacterized beta-barrel protein YwiB (DUF1934 family)
MNNNVIIRVSGLQKIDDTGENVELLATGKHYIKNGKHYLLYDEFDEESGVTTKNTIKFNETSAEVMRKGIINGKLIFSRGDNNQSIYSTPYGELLVEILTSHIELREQQDSINLQIDYELYANNNKVSDSKIEIDIRENEEIN